MNERKIAVLKEASDRKRREALDKTNQAITLLVKEGKRITFLAVAEAAGVSIAYLYKYDDLKERIDQLRKQQSQVVKSSLSQLASDKSKMVIINQLRERTKNLDAENRELRNQIEAIYERSSQFQLAQQELEVLKRRTLLSR